MKNKKIVITYGTFDLFHKGHLNILKRAKERGDYLIVGVTSDDYDRARGKLNVIEPLEKRIENVKKTGLADLIIVEEYEGQKVEDILKYNVDVFVIGSDWKGKFDYLKEYCDVVYLERTKGISSTDLRKSNLGILRMGIVGYGRIAKRMIIESKYVSGINIEGVYGRNIKKAKQFAEKYELLFFTDSYEELLSKVDAVYIATPHHTHYSYAKNALMSKKHVLCEKPLCLKEEEAKELFELADKNGVILMEALKTAYAPGFLKLFNIVKTGKIGKIVEVDATFTKLLKLDANVRELNKDEFGGAFTELASYVLLPIVKFLGDNPLNINFYDITDSKLGIDIFTKVIMYYKNSIGSGNVGLGAKKDGSLILSGTKGYIYVPSPWWKTEYFEIRGDNGEVLQRISDKFEGDGLRYELAEFYKRIFLNSSNYKLTPNDSIFISRIIEKFLNRK